MDILPYDKSLFIQEQKDDFPNLAPENFKITSPRDTKYNCIAWAANDKLRRWWPVESLDYYWPTTAPKINTIEAFMKAFEGLGYRRCETPDVEKGILKVALYCNKDNKPQHMARQLSNGKWTSKLGDHVDIEHTTLEVLEGKQYGKVKIFMSRSL